MVAGYQLVGVAGNGHRQQERVERIVSLDVRGQTFQDQDALQVVHHRADAVRLARRSSSSWATDVTISKRAARQTR